MSATQLKIVGFFRCGGFDHLVRFVTDAPENTYGQRFVIYQDGYKVVFGYQTAGLSESWLPIADLSQENVPPMDRSEQDEWAVCQTHLDAGYINADDKRTLMIDG